MEDNHLFRTNSNHRVVTCKGVLLDFITGLLRATVCTLLLMIGPLERIVTPRVKKNA